jgi:ribosomal protein S18 acetylase RimI-like enzyme
VIFRIPTAMRAWVEDVVVDDAVRGRGIGEALTLAAVSLAKARGAKTVDLTSRQSRKAAHRLYEKSGFHVRDTSVYRFGPKPEA